MNSQLRSGKAVDGRGQPHLGHKAALSLCLFIALFPPLHLAMVSGSLGMAMTFMAGGPLLIMIAIYLLRRSDERLGNGGQGTV